MAYDPDPKTKVLGVLETSYDPDAPATAQLLRNTEMTICRVFNVQCQPRFCLLCGSTRFGLAYTELILKALGYYGLQSEMKSYVRGRLAASTNCVSQGRNDRKDQAFEVRDGPG